MGFNLKEHLIGGKTFCCCLPTRAGVIVMSFLTMIVSLLLAIIIWFEVSTSQSMYIYEKRAFVLAGIVETILFITSALGFAGTIAKKLVFVRIYAYFLYFHFLLNVAIASYFLWMIHHATHTDVVAACERIANAQAHKQCTGLLKIATNVFVGVAAALLLIELYGAIIVTRYMRQLKFEKIQDKTIRTSRLASLHEQQMSRRMAQASDSEDIALLNASSKPTPAAEGDGFNPYENLGYRDEPDHHGLQEIPQADVENGYGGGTWRLEDIRAEAKEESVAGQPGPEQDAIRPLSPTYTHRQPETSAHGDAPPTFTITPPHPHS